MYINKVTRRDANLLLNMDKFSEKFVGCAITSLINFFSGYNQIELAVEYKVLIRFQISFGLIRLTIIL